MAPLAASLLDCDWLDLDRAVEHRLGLSVSEIFARQGEAAFRKAEQEAMLQALESPPMVIAAGGGWIAQPGNLAATESVALSLYLSVSPAVASRRLGDAADRPLLAGDPESAIRRLMVERERWFRLAGVEIEAGQSSDLVANAVVVAARHYGGW